MSLFLAMMAACLFHALNLVGPKWVLQGACDYKGSCAHRCVRLDGTSVVYVCIRVYVFEIVCVCTFVR